MKIHLRRPHIPFYRAEAKACVDPGQLPSQERYSEFSEGAKDLFADRAVPVIISSEDNQVLESFKGSWSDFSPGRIEDLPLVHGFASEIDNQRAQQLFEELPQGAYVSINYPLHQPGPFTNHEVLFQEALRDKNPAGPTETAALRLPGLDKLWQQGLTGKGQTIAVIDSGIFPHPDLKDRIVGWVDFAEGKAKPSDKYGHGTHVAGVIAGSGEKSGGAIKGVAPEANLVGVRIGSISDAIKALNWVIDNKDRYQIGVVNMSLGDVASQSWKHDPWALATQRAIDAGLVVVVSAGNEGPTAGTVATPGILPTAITVGAIDDGGTSRPDDDQVPDFSSRGPSFDGLAKPDVVAPGRRIYSTLAPSSSFDVPEFPKAAGGYFAVSGTSQAAPMVAGLAALLRQANPQLSQADLLAILKQSAYHYPNLEATAVGAGLVQADKALELAQNWPAATA